MKRSQQNVTMRGLTPEAPETVILENILSGKETGPKSAIALLNASTALACCGSSDHIGDGLDIARATIDDGSVLQKLRLLQRLRASFCIAVLLLTSSCSEREQAQTYDVGERFVSPADSVFLYAGRWDRSDPSHPSASWPGFSISTNIQGSSIKVRMNDCGNYFNVEVDGRFTKVIGGKSGKHLTYLLADHLANGPHCVKLQRRNINFDAPTEIEGFIVDDDARLTLPAKSPRKRIEFIGDSYTVGEGNEAVQQTLAWKDKYPVTNFAKSYASLLGEMMDAEVTAVCRSGSGMISSWTGDRSAPMSERYGWSLMEKADPAWSFDEPPLDLIVISLGLNDFTGLKDVKGVVSPVDAAEFRAAYSKLMAELRKRHPHARILALGSHVPWVRENVLAVVTAEKAAGNKDVFYAQYDEFAGGYVADGHPTVETHQKMARQIFDQLKLLGLLSDSGGLRDP